jgi:hypothetical protein
VNLVKVYEAVDAAVTADDDPDVKTRILVVYIAPAGGGLFLHRVGIGSHLIGGDPREDFSASAMRAVEKLWPEAPPKLRKWLHVAAHAFARSPIARRLMQGDYDDSDED